MGETSAKSMRGSGMEDVIFSGTSNKPSKYLAEVSITFDNTKNLIPTEYSNVSIARKYFRDGERRVIERILSKTPSVLALTRQNLEPIRKEFIKDNKCSYGAYEIFRSNKFSGGINFYEKYYWRNRIHLSSSWHIFI